MCTIPKVMLTNMHCAGNKHALQQLMALAAKLTCADEDGRLIIDIGQGCIKFVLLNAAVRFCQVGSFSSHVVLCDCRTPALPASQLHS